MFPPSQSSPAVRPAWPPSYDIETGHTQKVIHMESCRETSANVRDGTQTKKVCRGGRSVLEAVFSRVRPPWDDASKIQVEQPYKWCRAPPSVPIFLIVVKYSLGLRDFGVCGEETPSLPRQGQGGAGRLDTPPFSSVHDETILNIPRQHPHARAYSCTFLCLRAQVALCEDSIMWHGSGHMGLLLLLVSCATAFLLPAAPSPRAISSSTKNPIARFASSIDEAPSLVEPQEPQPQAQQEPPPRGNARRPLSPKPAGPWVLLEGEL